MPNYTGLEQSRPFGSFISGMEAADKMQYSALRNEASRAALDQQKLQRQTAEQFQATGDPRVLRGYDPALAVTLESNLATMDTNKQQAAIKRLTAGIDITDKALPYIVAASKSNPQAAAGMWPNYIADLKQAGIQPPPFMEQYSPEVLEGVYKQKEDIKTAIARINASSRLTAAELSANSRLGAANIAADARIGAAKIGAANRDAPKTIWGNMGAAAKAGNWAEFDFYQKLWDQQHPGTKPQLFKNDRTGTYDWVKAGDPVPTGLHPVSEDMFKALLAGQLGGAITPPAPPGTNPMAPPASATTGGISPLQQRAIDEKARRGR